MCGVDAFGSLASAGLGVFGKIGEHNAQVQAVKEHNQKVLQNFIQANVAASSMYGDMGRRFSYESRANQLEANAATMAGRASIGTGLASAGSSGFNGNSLTVGAVIADEERRIAENEDNYALKQDDLRSAYISEGKRVQAQAQDRINSMSVQSPPSGSVLGLNIANTVGEVANRYLKKRNEREY